MEQYPNYVLLWQRGGLPFPPEWGDPQGNKFEEDAHIVYLKEVEYTDFFRLNDTSIGCNQWLKFNGSTWKAL